MNIFLIATVFLVVLIFDSFKMVICAAVGCSSETGKTKNISIFRLPRDKLLRKEWLRKLKRTNLPADDNIRICHLHFTEDCFERDLKVSFNFYLKLYIYSIISFFYERKCSMQKQKVIHQRSR